MRSCGMLFKAYKPQSLSFSYIPTPLPRRCCYFWQRINASRTNSSASSLLASAHSCASVNTKDSITVPSHDRELWLHNTMSKSKELFKPKVEGKVCMYVCGVTAYDLSHIGHARVYVTFDVLFRYLVHLGYDVCYVRNFTDVDDKIIARANELSEDPLSLSKRFCEEFRNDMISLHCLPPSFEPFVSDHIPQIINMINKILENGKAYAVDGDVYFSVDKFPDYGKLSGRKVEDNRAGERVTIDTRKRNPADFALWKSAKKGEPFWESPWGHGRPGWHIECSAMSATYLGDSFDIHGGGMDLIFPHHENEIAQSCASCKESHISYWVHNGFVTIDSEKMSKSLGNFFTIRQVIDRYHPLALRLFLLSTHYRSPVNYSDALLESASERAYYIYQTLEDCERILGGEKMGDGLASEVKKSIQEFDTTFRNSMCDDMHTPVVLSALSEPLKAMNELVHSKKVRFGAMGMGLVMSGKVQGKKEGNRVERLSAWESSIRTVLSVLGLMPESYAAAVKELREKCLARANVSESYVLGKIEERAQARREKNYEKSDVIRRDLGNIGIGLMDTANGTSWRPALPLPLQHTIPSAL